MYSPEKRAPLSSISSSAANANPRATSENNVTSLDESLLDELQDILIHNVCKIDTCQRALEILDIIRTVVKTRSLKSQTLRVDINRSQKFPNADNDFVSSPSKIQRLESELSHVTMSAAAEEYVSHDIDEDAGVLHWDMDTTSSNNNNNAPPSNTLTRDDSMPMQFDDMDGDTSAHLDARTARRRRRASFSGTSNSTSTRSKGRGRKAQNKNDETRDSPLFMASPDPAESKQPTCVSYAEEKHLTIKMTAQSEFCKAGDMHVTDDRLSPPADIAMPLDDEEDYGIVTFDIQSSPSPSIRAAAVTPVPAPTYAASGMFTFNSFSSARDVLNSLYSAISPASNTATAPSMESVPAVVLLLTLSLQMENNTADAIRSFAVQYLSPWLQCLEAMRGADPYSKMDEQSSLPASLSPSKVKKKQRRIKFKEVCGASTSPPNDRLPNSHEAFEKTSIIMFEMLECLSTISKACAVGEMNHLLRQFAISLHVLSYRDNVISALHTLQTHSGMQVSDVHQVEVADLASLLHEELITRISESTGSTPTDNTVSLCCGTNNRSLLRHRSTWMLVAVVRYHLRWLFDEPPSRATTVVLTGRTPADSCRSELFTKVTMSPCKAFGGALSKLSFRPGNCALAPFSELPPSTIFVQALQQYFEGINFVFKGTHDTAARFSNVVTFYGVIREITSNFSSFINETMADLEANISLDPKLLYTAQVALAAEGARDYLLHTLRNDIVWAEGDKSGVWKKLEQFGHMILAHGLPEDMHYGLLSDLSVLLSLLSLPLLEDVHVSVRIINKFVKSSGGSKKGAVLKKDTRVASSGNGEICDLLDKCPFVFEFPHVIERAMPPAPLLATTLDASESPDTSWMMVDEMKLSEDLVF